MSHKGRRMILTREYIVIIITKSCHIEEGVMSHRGRRMILTREYIVMIIGSLVMIITKEPHTYSPLEI